MSKIFSPGQNILSWTNHFYPWTKYFCSWTKLSEASNRSPPCPPKQLCISAYDILVTRVFSSKIHFDFKIECPNFYFSVYVDASDASFEECTTLSFNFKEPEPTRAWNMTIIQISCDSANKAPPGCLQYMFGLTINQATGERRAQGVIKSFIFEGK